VAQIVSHCVLMMFVAAADFSIQPINADDAALALPLVSS